MKTKKSIKSKKTILTKKTLRKTTSKKEKKKSIKNFKETLNEEEIYLLNNNLLINPKNINKINKEILFNSGLFLKNRSEKLYSLFDPLALNTICLSSRLFSLLTNCVSDVILRIIKKNKNLETLINKKFKRLVNVDKLDTFSSDITLQLKILKMIINENVEPNFKKLNKNKFITIIKELTEFRNLISHFVYKKSDYQNIKISKNKRSELYQKNKLRNYNYIIDLIKKSQYILDSFYKNKDKIKLNSALFKRNYISMSNLIINLNIMCTIRERRKRLEKIIKNKETLNNLAKETLDFLNRKLNSNSDEIRNMTSRNIVNLILPRIESDEILTQFNLTLSNKSIKNHCKNI